MEVIPKNIRGKGVNISYILSRELNHYIMGSTTPVKIYQNEIEKQSLRTAIIHSRIFMSTFRMSVCFGRL